MDQNKKKTKAIITHQCSSFLFFRLLVCPFLSSPHSLHTPIPLSPHSTLALPTLTRPRGHTQPNPSYPHERAQRRLNITSLIPLSSSFRFPKTVLLTERTQRYERRQEQHEQRYDCQRAVSKSHLTRSTLPLEHLPNKSFSPHFVFFSLPTAIHP